MITIKEKHELDIAACEIATKIIEQVDSTKAMESLIKQWDLLGNQQCTKSYRCDGATFGCTGDFQCRRKFECVKSFTG